MKWKRLTGIKGLSPKDDDAGMPLVNTSSEEEEEEEWGREGEREVEEKLWEWDRMLGGEKETVWKEINVREKNDHYVSLTSQ